MNPTAKGFGVAGVVGGWSIYLQHIIAWAIHGAATNDWGAFPEEAAVSLLMFGITFVVYRAWPASDRTPKEPKS